MIDKEKYSKEGNFRGSSGIKLNKYYDFMRMFEYKKDLRTIMLEILHQRNYINIIGVETFGAMLGMWGHAYGYNSSFLLKEREHGNRKRFYGTHNYTLEHTILLDDVITTGETISEALGYLLLKYDILVNEVVVLKSKLKEIDGYKIRVVGN